MKKKLSITLRSSLSLLAGKMQTSFVSSRIAVTFLAILLSFSSFAQDVVYKKGGEVLKVTITEVGIDEIKYKKYDDPNGPIYALEKDMIAKIVYQNGTIETYQNKLFDPELYADQQHRAIKFNFLSPLIGFSEFTYEQNLKPGQSFETAVGIIGLGNNITKAGGVFVEGGYKFKRLPNFYNRGMRYTHIMQGSYVRPNLVLGFYSIDGELSSSEKQHIAFGALTLDLGRQWVLGDKFLIDLYWGIGYCLDNTDGEGGYHFAILNSGYGLGFRSGLKIGLLIK